MPLLYIRRFNKLLFKLRKNTKLWSDTHYTISKSLAAFINFVISVNRIFLKIQFLYRRHTKRITHIYRHTIYKLLFDLYRPNI